MRATLERARIVGMVAVEAVKGQRGDRYTRAQMTEGCDECILSEKSGIRNIRLDREKKGREYVSSSHRPIEGRCERAFRIYKAECWSQ